MLSLKKLKIRAFRGYHDKTEELLFDHPITLLYGENAKGKSSTLNALEWCLFGQECIGKKTGIRERVNWEVPNRYSKAGSVIVEAEFQGDKGTYVVRREQGRSKKKASGDVKITFPDGKEMDGNEAEILLPALFRTSFQDFATTVYQHQEAIRAILTQEPKDRNDAIDRLLGLSTYRDISRAINEAALQRYQTDLEARLEEFRGRCQQSIQTLDNLIAEEKANAEKQGIKPAHITLSHALSFSQGIAADFQAIAKEFGQGDIEVKKPVSIEDLTEFRQTVKKLTDSLWAKLPDVVKQEQLAARLLELAGLKGAYDLALQAFNDAQKYRDVFVKKHGDESRLAKEEDALRALILEMEARIRNMNARARLVKEAINYLTSGATDVKKAECPVCGSNAPGLLQHLQTEWEKKIADQVQTAEAELAKARSKTEEIDELKRQLQRLTKTCQATKTALQKQIDAIAKAIQQTIKSTDDPQALLTKRIQETQSELDRLAKTIPEKRTRIDAIYENLNTLGVTQQILQLQAKQRRIEEVWKSPHFKRLDAILKQASLLVQDAAEVRSVVTQASRQEAKARVEAAQTALSNHFSAIAKRPDVEGLVMEVTEDTRTGLNSYTFKTTDGSDPTPILNQGDLNCLALCIFLGLAQASPEARPFDFLIFDDPTQSLSRDTMNELVKVLDSVADQRNLILATSDLAFKERLTDGITKKKAVYEFLAWSDVSGPTVVLTNG